MNGVIKKILEDNFEEFKNNNKVREVCKKEVGKVLKCKDIKHGHTLYECPNCHEELQVPFTCKSRLCNSCGKLKTEEWTENIKNIILDLPHRHIVFTIPEELRNLFQKDRNKLKILSDEAANLLLTMYKKMRKTKEYVPGIVAGIHTFGRDMKWNPHIHILITEGAMVDGKEFKEVKFLRYESLRNSWKYILLTVLKRELKNCKEELKLINQLFKKLDKGMYVYAEYKPLTAQVVSRYIARYVSRPVIAESRITEYDGKNVTFWYQRHEDNKKITETVSAEEFIGKLLIHLPEKNFKMIRYYGIYARRSKRKARETLKDRQIVKKYTAKKWRERIIKSFGYDPILCPSCKNEMEVVDIYYPKYGSLIELIFNKTYEKVTKEYQREECA